MADFTFLSSDLVKVLSKKYLQVVHRIKNIFSSFICYSRYYLLWKHHKTELRWTQATPVLRMREKVPTVNKVTLSHLGHSFVFANESLEDSLQQSVMTRPHQLRDISSVASLLVF